MHYLKYDNKTLAYHKAHQSQRANMSEIDLPQEITETPTPLLPAAAGEPDACEELIQNEAQPEIVEKPKRKRSAVKPKVAVPTSDPNIEVEMRSHKPGRKKRRVVVYTEDLPREEITIVQKSRQKGRPAGALLRVSEPAKQEITTQGPDVLTYHRPNDKVELTQKQLRQLELAQQFATIELAAGRKLRQTAKGVVDKRCIADRSAAQIASSKALVLRNAMKRQERHDQNRRDTALTVRDVIGELAVASRAVPEAAAPAPAPAPAAAFSMADLFKN